MLTIGRKVSTLQLEQHALTSRDLYLSLTHPLESQRDFVLVAARYAAREDMSVIAVIEGVRGGLQHADMRLWRLIKIDSAYLATTTHLDAHLKLRS